MPTRAAVLPSVDEVVQIVRESAAIVCERPVADLGEFTRLDDIDADSLARVGIADLVEERLAAQLPNLHIPDGNLACFTTIRDIAEWVVRHAPPDAA